MRCVDCVWLDKDTCLARNIKIIFPNLPRMCPYYNTVPELAVNYAKEYLASYGIRESDTSMIKDAKHFKNFLKKMKLVRL